MLSAVFPARNTCIKCYYNTIIHSDGCPLKNHTFFFQSKTYMCSWQGDTLCFTVDFALGFTCFDSKTKVRVKEKENITLYSFTVIEVIIYCIFFMFVSNIYSSNILYYLFICLVSLGLERGDYNCTACIETFWRKI